MNKGFKCDVYTKKHFKESHTKEKPHECEVCKKTFSQKAHLNTHLRIHTGDRPFSCDICHKRFSDSSNRNRHLRTHQQNN